MACSNAMFNPVQLFQNPILGYNHAFFSGVVPVFFFALAGRLLPNEPLKRFPLAVFLSPLPMTIDLLSGKNKKSHRLPTELMGS
jgi:hypothetical protein